LLTTAAGSDPDASYLEELKTDTTHWAQAVAGLWAVEVGNTILAKSHLEVLPVPQLGEFDLPSVQGSVVAALRGRLAGLRGDWDEAVRVLEPVTGERAPRHMTSTRLPNWIRAEAEEELGRFEEAAELYTQIAEGYRFGDYEIPAYGLTYSFVHRRAALLYGQLGERDKAIEHWRAFLDAFTQPDPEFEWMVEEGRTALARLEG
jgi:tetratricopeptide (TPR) repeat protein